MPRLVILRPVRHSIRTMPETLKPVDDFVAFTAIISPHIPLIATSSIAHRTSLPPEAFRQDELVETKSLLRRFHLQNAPLRHKLQLLGYERKLQSPPDPLEPATWRKSERITRTPRGR